VKTSCILAPPHMNTLFTLRWIRTLDGLEDEWLIAACDRAPSHDGGSMWFMLAIRLWFMGDRVGQLEESGEYWMGWMRVV
jgi:hypothetical protein